MRLRNPEGALTEEKKPIVKALLAEGWRNQDIQALLNIGRDATINSGRITEVKQNAKIAPASATALEHFKAKKQAYDPKTGLNLFEIIAFDPPAQLDCPTRSTNAISASNVESQYLVGSVSSSGRSITSHSTRISSNDDF